jgi:LmbE family N-acetylglucosaminyl deacetylase
MSTVLVVVAHPDDEVLGAGGTIAKRARAGDRVVSLALGDGVSARYDTPDRVPQEEIDQRREHARQAGDVLGIDAWHFRDFPDNRFDSVDLLDLVKAVESVADRVQPDVIYTHHSGDLNVDHRRTHQAVMTAFRPEPGSTVNEIYSFEVLSSTEWSTGGSGDSFDPNVFVDVKEVWSQKLEAMRCYADEIATFPHPRSEEAIESLAKRRGSQAGRLRAEAFLLERRIDSSN